MKHSGQQQRYRGKPGFHRGRGAHSGNAKKHYDHDDSGRHLRDRAQPDDIKVKIRQPGKIVLHNVPDETTVDEIKAMLQGWILEIPILSVNFLRPKTPKRDFITLIAFVQLDCDASAERIINYYNQHKAKLASEGYMYTNEKGVSCEIYLEYCYQKTNKNKDVKLEHYDAKDVEEEIESIKKERETFLSTIRNLEEELKRRLPDLFVSEFEMNELRKEEYDLNEKIKGQLNQLDLAQSCLKDVKEDIKQLNDDDDANIDDLLKSP